VSAPSPARTPGGPYDALKKISGKPKIQFVVDNDMTGSTIPAALLSHDECRLRRTGDEDEKVDATLDFTLKRATRSRPIRPSTGRYADGTSCRQLLIYLQALGTKPVQDR